MGLSNQRVSLLLCFFLSIVPVMTIDIPKALAVYPGLIGVIFYCIYQYGFKINLGISKPVLILSASILGLSTLSLLWALHFDPSIKQVKTFLVFLPLQILLISLAARIPKDQIEPYIHFYPCAVAVAALLMIFETYSGGVIFNFTHGHALGAHVETYEYNRGSVLMVISSFGALAILRQKIQNKFAPLIILIPLAAALTISESQSAQLMFFIGFATIFLFPYKCKTAWTFLKIAIPLAMLATPFLVMVGFHHITSDVANITLLKNANVGPRLEIWDYVARYALESPLIGHGVDVTRSIKDFDCHYIFNNANTVTHPHNFILQIWIEFGLLGILIAMALMYQFITLIQTKYTVAQQKIMLPTFMTALLAASTAYGMWQGMWLGALFYAAAMTLLTTKVIDKPADIDNNQGN